MDTSLSLVGYQIGVHFFQPTSRKIIQVHVLIVTNHFWPEEFRITVDFGSYQD